MANAVANRNSYKIKVSIKIAVIYMVMGALWIFFSDNCWRSADNAVSIPSPARVPG